MEIEEMSDKTNTNLRRNHEKTSVPKREWLWMKEEETSNLWKERGKRGCTWSGDDCV